MGWSLSDLESHVVSGDPKWLVWHLSWLSEVLVNYYIPTLWLGEGSVTQHIL